MMMEERKWGPGAIIWFVLMILAQWILFTNEITKPAYYQNGVGTYLIIGLIGTAMYLWLALSKSKAALITILAVAVINMLFTLVQGGGASALLTLICPGITYLVAHEKVE